MIINILLNYISTQFKCRFLFPSYKLFFLSMRKKPSTYVYSRNKNLKTQNHRKKKIKSLKHFSTKSSPK